MNPFQKISAFSTSGMRAQAQRLQVVSENIANVDTYGYRRKLVAFEATFNRTKQVDEIGISRVMLDPTPGERAFEPNNPFADEQGYVVSSNVNMMTEFADAREAGRSYEAGLEMLRQARQMYTSLLDILKR